MKKQKLVRHAPLSLLALLVLGACDSSNDPDLSSQAIDGYIVGGFVECDENEAGQTGAAGLFFCAADTELASVRGGMDVGFDAAATESNTVFAGVLRAPADLGYVTPLTTVAVQMASTQDGYDPFLWTDSVEKLGAVLGNPELDLSADASQDMELIRLNAQLQQVLSAFVRSEADYGTSIEALSTVIEARSSQEQVLDLEADVAGVLTAINAALLTDYSDLAISPATRIDSLAVTIQSTNLKIAAAASPSLVAATATDNSADNAVVNIDRSSEAVVLRSFNGVQQVSNLISIDDFEDSSLNDGYYQTQVGQGLEEVAYINDVLDFDLDMDEVQVTMGFELKSTITGDSRSLSFFSDDIYLSATANDPDSLVIKLSEDATFHAAGNDSTGTATTAEVLVAGRDTFSNSEGNFSVNYGTIVDKLDGLGFEDIFASTGNYEMTLLIGGIAVNEKSGSTLVPAKRHLINVGTKQINGAGFKGYLSYTH